MDLKKLAERSWNNSILSHRSPIFVLIIKDPPLLLAESGGSFDSLRAGMALFAACVVCIFVVFWARVGDEIGCIDDAQEIVCDV